MTITARYWPVWDGLTNNNFSISVESRKNRHDKRKEVRNNKWADKVQHKTFESSKKARGHKFILQSWEINTPPGVIGTQSCLLNLPTGSNFAICKRSIKDVHSLQLQRQTSHFREGLFRSALKWLRIFPPPPLMSLHSMHIRWLLGGGGELDC